MRKYRLVAYTSKGKRYLQIVRDVKTETKRTMRIVTSIGPDIKPNREKAETLIGFLKSYASDPTAPIAIGTIDKDFFDGLELGMIIGRKIGYVPCSVFRDFARILGSLDVETVVNVTHYYLSKEEIDRLVKWIKGLPEDMRGIALFFKWSYSA
jgi:pyruvate-formate lyase-activating enzyme